MSIRRLALALCVACTIVGGSVTAQDISSPEATVRSFISAFFGADMKKAAACVEDVPATNPALPQMEADMKKVAATCTVRDIKATEDGDNATVTVSCEVANAEHKGDKFDSTVKLHKSAAGWRIVVDKDAEKQQKNLDQLNAIAYVFCHPEVVGLRKEAAIGVACLSNMKQVALGTLMLTQDYDEKFAVKPENFKKLVMPYVKNESIFHCPSDPGGPVSYAFNPHLAGVSTAKVRSPEKTVMIYEGKDGKLSFKHGGKAGIAYASGKAAQITEAEAKNLRWMP